MANLCIIPARGGSKRIPRKNIKDFLGKPIIAYSIEAALESGVFSKVIVSTDDPEIAEVAKKYGAEVPFMRSVQNSDDYATTADVLEEVLNNFIGLNTIFSAACCIYPTAPFTNSQILQKGFQKLIECDADSVLPMVAFEYPVWRGLRKNRNNKAEMIWKEHLNTRSQDLEPVYHDAGQWYWFDVDKFLKTSKVFTENTIGIELSSLQVQDIDNEQDWHIAELKYGYLQSLK
ncbi:pseudaminic acid cytidylyltransferase [Rhodonellum sp.]|uniref:pseudaminic acid cytidylyltransferase n=1 Tax=Rhodonellum sp. TaxID=2231180 RepID=UPI00272555AE|nr:pseudaminic acid cytidylyltransferase [Rhodonellum sp.]MDO9551543.1 pseudaminic acid cytidylyltransferase [Rhodonellum sp.]